MLKKSEMFCPTCGRNMRPWKSDSVKDKLRWRCGKWKRGQRCNATRSLRHSSWFTKSNLTLLEIMLLTYDIMQKMPSQAIQVEHKIDQRNACDWFQFCKQVVLDFIESKSRITGGEGKVVEIDESKFRKRKYQGGYYVKGQ